MPDVFHYGQDADAVFLQLALIDRGVVAITAEPVELPDEDKIEFTFFRIFDHALEIGPIVGQARNRAIDIFGDDGKVVPFRVRIAVANLSFDRLFGLVCG